MTGSVTPRSVVVGGALVGCVIAVAIVGPLVAADPLALDIDGGLSALGAPLPPSPDAPLGTDPLGRDVWSRVVHGAATSLWIALAATMLAALLGIAVGVTAGYLGGRADRVLMRVVDLALAFPFLLLAILLAALLHQAEIDSPHAPVIIPLAAVAWTTFARLVRARTMALAREEYVLAAHSLGASTLRVILRHLVPNLGSVIAVVATFTFAQSLLGEAVLSYLGLGPPPPAPTWGRMLHEGRVYYRSAPWLVVAPGVAIVVAVAAFNVLGEGLRAWLSPGERSVR